MWNYETVGQSFKAIGFKKTCISLSALGLVPREIFPWSDVKPARFWRVWTHETTGPCDVSDDSNGDDFRRRGNGLRPFHTSRNCTHLPWLTTLLNELCSTAILPDVS